MNISFSLELFKKAELAIPALRRCEQDMKKKVLGKSYSAHIDDIAFDIIVDTDPAVVGNRKTRTVKGCVFFDENGVKNISNLTLEIYIFLDYNNFMINFKSKNLHGFVMDSITSNILEIKSSNIFDCFDYGKFISDIS